MKTVKNIYGITVNGSGVPVADEIAALVMQSSNGAITANTNQAIVAQVNENGEITISLNYIDAGFYVITVDYKVIGAGPEGNPIRLEVDGREKSIGICWR